MVRLLLDVVELVKCRLVLNLDLLKLFKECLVVIMPSSPTRYSICVLVRYLLSNSTLVIFL